MKPSLSSLFKSLPEAELPAGLSERIFSEIGRFRGREVHRMLLFSRVRVGASGLMFLGAIFFTESEIFGSEFARLFSLVISDTVEMTAYGWELFWLFLETFPTIPFVFLLVPLFFFLISLGMHVTAKHHSRFLQTLSA